MYKRIWPLYDEASVAPHYIVFAEEEERRGEFGPWRLLLVFAHVGGRGGAVTIARERSLLGRFLRCSEPATKTKLGLGTLPYKNLKNAEALEQSSATGGPRSGFRLRKLSEYGIENQECTFFQFFSFFNSS